MVSDPKVVPEVVAMKKAMSSQSARMYCPFSQGTTRREAPSAGPGIRETTRVSPASQTTRANQGPGQARRACYRRSPTGRARHIRSGPSPGNALVPPQAAGEGWLRCLWTGGSKRTCLIGLHVQDCQRETGEVLLGKRLEQAGQRNSRGTMSLRCCSPRHRVFLQDSNSGKIRKGTAMQARHFQKIFLTTHLGSRWGEYKVRGLLVGIRETAADEEKVLSIIAPFDARSGRKAEAQSLGSLIPSLIERRCRSCTFSSRASTSRTCTRRRCPPAVTIPTSLLAGPR
jgi:hypothetical protein